MNLAENILVTSDLLVSSQCPLGSPKDGTGSMLLTYHMMVCVFIELDDSMGQERMNLFHSATIEYSLDSSTLLMSKVVWASMD